MKLKSIVIEGFRGVPRKLELKLDGKSLCLLGENGRGKTTIVDALEYWSKGEIESFKAADYGLAVTINLDHGPPATITCERQGYATLRRSLSGGRSEEIEVLGPTRVDGSSTLPPELPLLRHSTMTKFMSATSFDKQKELLRLLGLDPLIAFRAAVVTASNEARRRAEELAQRAQAERQSLVASVAPTDLVAAAEELRQQARLSKPITSEDDIRDLATATTPAVQARVDRSVLVEELAAAITTLSDAAVAPWNQLCGDADARQAESLRTMIIAAQKVLPIWLHDNCPLCLTAADTAALAASLSSRSAELAELHEEVNNARRNLRTLATTGSAISNAARKVVASPPTTGWPKDDALRTLANEFETWAAGVNESLKNHAACAVPPAVLTDDDLKALREAAVMPEESPETAALTRLVSLRDTSRRVRDLEREAEVRKQLANAVSALTDLTEERITETVDAAISRLGGVAADYYGRLIKNRVYTDVKLIQTTKRKGGIDFSLTYDKEHSVSPPQRVVSESQLNALGFAFFLARLKVEETPWRTLVLDDVVNSFDSNHRMGVARLLSEEFADWQVLFFTHDSVFVSVSRAFFEGWRFHQIIAWSPKEGPTIDDEDPLKQLETRLERGETSGLGELARFALERGLSTPLEKLRLPIFFSRHGVYSARDYRDALDHGLVSRGSKLSDVTPVLTRMKAANYLSNLSAHDRQTDPRLSTEDIEQMVDDLQALQKAFVCASCQRPVWDRQTKDRASFQCKCAKLAV